MLKKTLTAAAVVLGASVMASAPASAMPGYATPRLEIKAGPDSRYPTVGFARYDTPLEINGCLRNWTWCDVTTRRARGWVHGQDIQAASGGRRIEYGAPWKVPSSDFDFDTYWDKNYRGQQFYRERDRYDQFDNDDGRPTSNNDNDDDRDQRWRKRYSQTYTYNDDSYYRECRTKSDPGGVIAGSLIGGLIANASGGRNRGAKTAAGVIVGGTAGAVLTRHLECEDRSYAYKTYSQALNSGRENSNWQWENDESDNYGDFRVNDYYTDPDGFRCATFTQQVYVDDRREIAKGRACQQPDGAWAIVN